MPDYSKSSNNRKKEEENGEEPTKSERRIEKVVTEEVVVKKHGIGRKFKDVVRSVDVKGVGKHVLLAVILPLTKKMVYDAWVESGNRVIFPNAPRRPMIDAQGVQRSIFNYGGMSNNPISRSSSIPLGTGRLAPPREIGPRASSIVQHASVGGEQYIFSNRDDAVRVLETLRNNLDMYEEPISLLDLYDAMGREDLGMPTDRKWGWNDLSNVKVLQSRDGYILDFPKAEPI